MIIRHDDGPENEEAPLKQWFWLWDEVPYTLDLESPLACQHLASDGMLETQAERDSVH